MSAGKPVADQRYVQRHVYLTPDLDDEVRRLADAEGLSASSYLRMLVTRESRRTGANRA